MDKYGLDTQLRQILKQIHALKDKKKGLKRDSADYLAIEVEKEFLAIEKHIFIARKLIYEAKHP